MARHLVCPTGTHVICSGDRRLIAAAGPWSHQRQIGDELVIWAATVERHVIDIFNKLGFNSRSQLAAWVVEHGLAHH